jgi:transposase
VRVLIGARERLIRMRKDLEGHVRGVLKVFGVCMTSVGTGKLRRDFRDQLAAAADMDPAIALLSETFIPLHKTLCIARDALDDQVRMMTRENDLARRLMTVPPSRACKHALPVSGCWSHRGVGIYRDAG